MDRRDFLRTTGGLLASAALHARYAAAEEPSPAPAPAGGRQILPMNRSWRWAPGKLDAAAAPGFDDAHFSRVVLPHSNVRMPWHSFDDKDYEFVSTYRRRFRLLKAILLGASLAGLTALILAMIDGQKNPCERVRAYLCKTDPAGLQCKSYQAIVDESIHDSSADMRSQVRAQCQVKIERLKTEDGVEIK